MHLRTSLLTGLLLATSLSLAQAQTTTQPTDVLSQAKAFAKQHVLVSEATCVKQTAGLYFCTAPVNPGVTSAPFGFICQTGETTGTANASTTAPEKGCYTPLPLPVLGLAAQDTANN